MDGFVSIRVLWCLRLGMVCIDRGVPPQRCDLIISAVISGVCTVIIGIYTVISGICTVISGTCTVISATCTVIIWYLYCDYWYLCASRQEREQRRPVR